MKKHLNKSAVSILVILIVFLGSTSVVWARPVKSSLDQQEIETAIPLGLDYLGTQLNEDGGIRWFDENSSMAASIRVVQALAAAGYTQDLLTSKTGKSPIDFINANAGEWLNQEEIENKGFNVGRAGQLLTAVAAANEDPHHFGQDKLNLIHEINLHFDPSSGVYGTSTPDNVIDQLWGMIGLAANNAAVPEDAGAWLISVQSEDGSWNDGFGSYLDTTPLGIIALLSTRQYDPESPSIQSAIEFMVENQQPSGGWQSEWDTTTNANITGLMLQAINLLGQNPVDETWQQPEGNPETALLAVQGENGAFGADFANAFSTADPIIALSGRSITDLGYLEIASDGFDFVFAAQEDAGGWGSVGQTLDILLTLRAAGWQPNSINSDQGAPLEYIKENLDPYLETGPDAIGKVILGLIAAEQDPSNFNGIDLIQKLLETYDESTGAFGNPENTWHQSMAILGLYAAKAEIPNDAIESLLNLQREDGGWEYTPGLGTWPDNTALAIQALLAAGYTSEQGAVSGAIEYLRNTQNPASGGWGDSSTTAFALMAINALNESAKDWVTDNGKDPISNLLSYQKANGAFMYSREFPEDNLMATVTALFVVFDGDYLFEGNLASAPHQAAVIVETGDDEPFANCVSFDEDTIRGLDLLDRSGFSYDTDEGFINSIMDVSNLKGETNYWSYWSWDGRQWNFKNSSAGDSIVLPGTVEAWYFTSWEVFPSIPPEIIPDIQQICASNILISYSAQPYLDYNDLFDVPTQELAGPIEVQEDPRERATETPVQAEFTEMPQPDDPSQPTESTIKGEPDSPQTALPLIIIAVAGGLALIIILVIIMKKGK